MIQPATLAIGHVDTGLALRGGQWQLLLLARGLRERGYHQLIVCPGQSELNHQARAEGLPVFDLPARDFKHVRGIVGLRRRLHQQRLSLLHAHDGAGQTIAWLASLGTPVRRVASRRVTFLPARRLDYRLKYRYTCHAVVAVSQFVGRIVESTGIPPEMIHVIPDGIEIPTELPDGAAKLQARAAWGFAEHDFVIGHVGGFSPEKGQDLAIEAFETVQSHRPAAKLLLAGQQPPAEPGAYRGNPAARKEGICFAGYQNNLSNFFAALDLFIMPSRSEGLGSAALQAMSYALPVVAARVGGLPEVVEEDATGWLVAPNSPGALADGIIAAASNRSRLHQFALNARERARDFSADVMIEKTIDLYARLLEAQQAGSTV